MSITQEALQMAEGPVDALVAPIASLIFVRHGATHPAEDDSVDADRARLETLRRETETVNPKPSL